MATKIQADVCGVLDELKFEHQEPDENIYGGPVTYLVTEDTLEFLKGKTITVNGEGQLNIDC